VCSMHIVNALYSFLTLLIMFYLNTIICVQCMFIELKLLCFLNLQNLCYCLFEKCWHMVTKHAI
jgi:hypothetical protein